MSPSSVASGEEAQHAQNYGCGFVSLPATHQRYLFEKVRILCSSYLRKERSSLIGIDAKGTAKRGLVKTPWNGIT